MVRILAPHRRTAWFPNSTPAPRRPSVRFARAVLLVLVLAIAILPTFTLGNSALAAHCPEWDPSCLLSGSPAPIDVPACGSIPGLAEPPAPPKPLAFPDLPILPATHVGV
jgi:hypothetical protein